MKPAQAIPIILVAALVPLTIIGVRLILGR